MTHFELRNRTGIQAGDSFRWNGNCSERQTFCLSIVSGI